MVTAVALLAHVGPHAGGGHGTGALAIIAIAVLVGGWVAVAVAAWLFLRARVDSPEPPDTRAQPPAHPPAQRSSASEDGEPEPPPAYG
jgi:hypothetical protein